MNDYTRANQQRWDELVPFHAQSAFYDLASFKAGKISLLDLERTEVGDVSGKTLLHLQCHFGMDTLSWARLGATVTGSDFSEQAIAQARALSKELGIAANFVCSDIYALPDALSGQFDIVFTSYGTIGWLPDLSRWGQVIGHFLKAGGTFYIVNGHPFKDVFEYSKDARGLEDAQVTYSYFSKEPIQGEVQGSYAGRHAPVTHTTTYEWMHQLSEIVNSLIAAGLTIEFLHEFPFCNWACFPGMEQGEDGWWRIKGNVGATLADAIPLMFSLKARKM